MALGVACVGGCTLGFTTPNVADTKFAMVKLHYEGEEVDAWRLVKTTAFIWGRKKEEMLRRVVEDSFARSVLGFHDSLVLAALRWALVEFGEGFVG